jgi:DNA-directed RNA polymerase beta subunit
VVDYVDSERIIVKADHNVDGTISREVTADIYTLTKFKRSNQNTCINQRPIVNIGERVDKGRSSPTVPAPTGARACSRQKRSRRLLCRGAATTLRTRFSFRNAS